MVDAEAHRSKQVRRPRWKALEQAHRRQGAGDAEATHGAEVERGENADSPATAQDRPASRRGQKNAATAY